MAANVVDLGRVLGDPGGPGPAGLPGFWHTLSEINTSGNSSVVLVPLTGHNPQEGQLVFSKTQGRIGQIVGINNVTNVVVTFVIELSGLPGTKIFRTTVGMTAPPATARVGDIIIQAAGIPIQIGNVNAVAIGALVEITSLSPFEVEVGGNIRGPGADFATIYPVGSIYMTVNPVNPGTLFTGTTWARWGNGRVPVGVDEGNAQFQNVEQLGGAATHTLTVAQMPSHTHTQNGHTHTGGSHGHTGGGHSHTVIAMEGLGVGRRVQVGPDQSASTGFIRMSVSLFNGQGPTFSNANSFVLATGSSDAAVGAANVGALTTVTPAIQANGSGNAHNNLQPFITCYMWKRTS